MTFLPMILMPFIGVKLGVTSAQQKDKPIDTFIRAISVAGMAFPVFWTGAIFRAFSGITLQNFTNSELWFPTFGMSSLEYGYPLEITKFRIIDSIISNEQILLWDTLQHLVLPVICIMWISLAGITRMTRSSMLDVLEQDYIRTARAKGLSESKVVFKHALRNALNPVVTSISGWFASLMAGVVFVEYIFGWKGLGNVLVQALNNLDVPVVSGCILIISIIFVLINIGVDIMYSVLDPKVRLS